MFLIAFVYQLIGFFMGMVIREVCYVPRNFWQGIVVMTGMSNWGNLRQYSICLALCLNHTDLMPELCSECDRHVSCTATPLQPCNGPISYVSKRMFSETLQADSL